MNIYIDGIIYSLQKSGGVTRYTNELISGLVKLGYKVVVIMHPNPLSYPTANKNLELITINPVFNINSKLNKYLNYPFSKLCIKKYFKKNNITNGIFHSTYLTHYNNLKIPGVITIHDMTREKFPVSFNRYINKIIYSLTKNTVRNATAIICVSQQTRDDLCKYYKINSDKVYITYLGVDSSFTTKMEFEKEIFRTSNKLFKPYILYVGTRSSYKNFKTLINAFSKWKHHNSYMLVMVGGNCFIDEEAKYIKDKGLTNDIINFNFASNEDLVMFYNCANSFVFPSLSEGFGLPLLEAMACGTQVLASDISIFREIAKDVPFYFDPNNEESIINTLNDSLQKDIPRIDDGIKIAKKFSWETTVIKTIEVYNNLLKQ